MALVVSALSFGTVSRAEAAEDQPVNRDAFLRAIAEVETGCNARAVGRQGERGMYQFNRTTWRLHTSRSFHEAHNPTVSFSIAAKHFDWLHSGLVRAGRKPTPYLLAAAWNAGLGRATGGRLPAATRDYAVRVSNIVTVAERTMRTNAIAAATPARPVPVVQATAVQVVPMFRVTDAPAPIPVVPAAPASKGTPRFVIALIE